MPAPPRRRQRSGHDRPSGRGRSSASTPACWHGRTDRAPPRGNRPRPASRPGGAGQSTSPAHQTAPPPLATAPPRPAPPGRPAWTRRAGSAPRPSRRLAEHHGPTATYMSTVAAISPRRAARAGRRGRDLRRRRREPYPDRAAPARLRPQGVGADPGRTVWQQAVFASTRTRPGPPGGWRPSTSTASSTACRSSCPGGGPRRVRTVVFRKRSRGPAPTVGADGSAGSLAGRG